MISFSPASRRPSSTPCPLPSSASCLASRCSIPFPRPPSGSEGAGEAPPAALPRRPPPLRPAGKRNAAPPGSALAAAPGPAEEGRRAAPAGPPVAGPPAFPTRRPAEGRRPPPRQIVAVTRRCSPGLPAVL